MSESTTGQLAHLDDTIHGRLRLAVMAYLSSVNPAEFTELQRMTGATNGNLSTHLSKLEAAHYVRLEKDFVANRPRTQVYLTDQGREAWLNYLEQLRTLLAPSSATE